MKLVTFGINLTLDACEVHQERIAADARKP